MTRNNWGTFALWIAGAAVGSLVTACAFAVLADPYGRLQIRKSSQIAVETEARLLTVSRAVDPAFDSAIIGNSTSMLLRPESLDTLTGRKFVSLSIYGTGSDAQMAVMRLFLRYHPQAKTIIIALDDASWCRDSKNQAEWRPFPFWLYSTVPVYLAGLANNLSIGLIRLAFRPHGSDRLDGYNSYEHYWLEHGYNDPDVIKKKLTRSRPIDPPGSGDHAAAPLLARLIDELQADTSAIIVWTPRYINIIPQPGSPAAAADASCRAAFVSAISGHTNVRILDWSQDDRPDNHDVSNFFDYIHYRGRLAGRIERDIAANASTE